MTLFIDEVEVAMIASGEATTVTMMKSKDDTDHVQVYDENGALIFDEVFTWEDLEERDFEVVIDG